MEEMQGVKDACVSISLCMTMFRAGLSWRKGTSFFSPVAADSGGRQGAYTKEKYCIFSRKKD